MSERLTKARALELMREVVAEYGENYVYPTVGGVCRYVDDGGSPSCLVGHVLHRFGVPLKDIERHEDSDAATVARILTNATPRAQDVLREAQGHQDRGSLWGVALREAERA